jgi:hypothetical protein
MQVMPHDSYVWSARVAPAALVVTPAIAFGLALGVKLDAVNDLWGIVSFALLPLAAALARQAGHRVQDKLWARWGGSPASRRLWLDGAVAPTDVLRRRADVVALLGGVTLPSQADESADPMTAEAEYRGVVRRVIAVLRSGPADLMAKENASYGFCRNLYGLKPHGLAVAIIVAMLSIGVPSVAGSDVIPGGPWWVPTGIAVINVTVWLLITPAFVRPAAEAWADRLYEAVQVAAREPSKP